MLTKSMAQMALLMALCISGSPAQADWLDVHSDSIELRNLRTFESGVNLNAREGDRIQITCRQTIGLCCGHDLWETATEQRWDDLIQVDGKTIASRRPGIAAGTIMGKKSSSNLLSTKTISRPSSFSYAHEKIEWIAAGEGLHEVSCVLNQPKGVSDDNPNNNEIKALLLVMKQEQSAQAVAGSNGAEVPATASGTASSTRGVRPQVSTGAQSVPPPVPVSGDGPTAVGTVSAPATTPPARKTANSSPTNACAAELRYYQPRAPVLRSVGAGLAVGNQFETECQFAPATQRLEWTACDETAQALIQRVGRLNESSSPYSGVTQVDGSTLGVSTSPADGGPFRSRSLWSIATAGSHEIACRIDNPLRFVVPGATDYLVTAVTVQVASQGAEQASPAFDETVAVSVPAAVSSRGGLLTDQAAGIRAAPAASQPAAGQGSGRDAVNPALNSQPQVPSARGRGGNGLINPPLNPQPEVLSPITGSQQQIKK
jgi:hypothetical protein